MLHLPEPADIPRQLINVDPGRAGAPTEWIGWLEDHVLHWDQVLASAAQTSDAKTVAAAPILLLAPSGSGKTHELCRLAQQLSSEGRPVAAFEARRLVRNGLASELSASEQEALSEWRKDNGKGLVVLIDALDEVFLEHRTLVDLGQLLVGEGLLPNSVQFVMSAREEAWHEADALWLREFAKKRPATRSLRPLTELGEQQASAHDIRPIPTQRSDRDTEGSIRSFRLRELSPTQVGEFAKYYLLAPDRVAVFLDAIEKSDIRSLFGFRPRDVQLLKDYWIKNGRLDSWRDVLNAQLRSGYQERNSARGHHRCLTLERYLDGLRRIAAVTELSGHGYVLAPTSSFEGSLPHACEVFPDWRPEEIEELFSSPLLVARQVQTDSDAPGDVPIQLRQGELPSYLAATWLARIFVSAGMEDDVIESLVMKPLGHDRSGVPRDRSNLAGWTAALVAGLRKPIYDACPILALSHGDPSELSENELRSAIEGMLLHSDSQRFRLSRARRRKVARPNLEPQVVVALTRPMDVVPKVNLLKLAQSGSYQSAILPALEIAFAQEQDEHLRAAAIELVASLGSQDQKERLAELVSETLPFIRRAMYNSLVPAVLNGPRLLTFLEAEVTGDLVYEFRRKPLDLNLNERASLARALNERLGAAGQRRKGSARIGIEVMMLETAGDDAPLTDEFITLLERIEKADRYYHIARDERIALVARLTRPQAWTSVWSTRITCGYVRQSNLILCPIVEEHIGWLLAQVVELPANVEWPSVNSLAWGFLSSLDGTSRTRVKATLEPGSSGDKLMEMLEGQLGTQPSRVSTTSRDELREAQCRTNSAAIREHAEAIARGEHHGALSWAYDRLEDSTGWATALEKLRGDVDEDLVPIILEGFIRWWPQCGARVPDGQSRNNGELWGLIGVAFDVERRGVRTLSASEVRTATFLALAATNNTPEWFGALYATHESIVSVAVREAVFRLWSSPTVSSTFLDRLSRFAAEPVRRHACALVCEALDDKPPGTSKVLLDAVDLMLASNQPPDAVALLCERELGRPLDEDWRVAWLTLWSHLAPTDAAVWIQHHALDSSSKAMVGELCRHLGWDLDHHKKESWSRFWEPTSLERWIPLLMAVFPKTIQRDNHDGNAVAIAWGSSEYGGHLLEGCQRHLAGNGTAHAAYVLGKLTRHNDPAVSEWARGALASQFHAMLDANQKTWDLESILGAERYRVRVPLTSSELQRVVVADLKKIDARLRHGDFSYADLIPADADENIIQKWMASELSLVSTNVYSVVRESAVKDDNLIDISAFKPSVGRVPIEIKPLSRKKPYTIDYLQGTIRDQLVGKYMRPSDVTHGVLLIVRLDGKAWRYQSFEDGVTWLQKYAGGFLESHGKSVTVVAVDLQAARKGATIRSPNRNAKPRRSISLSGTRRD